MHLTEDQVELFLTEDVGQLDEEVLQYLIESRVDFVKKQHKDKISTDHDPEAATKTSDEIIDHISDKIDPSPRKEHTSWLTNRYKSGEYKLSDNKRIKKLMSSFVDTKKHLENQDINSYQSLDHLKDAVVAASAAKDVAQKSEKENTVHDMKEIYNDSGVTGYKIPNKATSIKNYGPAGKIEKCSWCTSSPGGNHFNNYEGGKYTMHIPNKDSQGISVLQLNHSSGQIMNKQNVPVEFGDEPFRSNVKHIHNFAINTADMEGDSAAQSRVLLKTKHALDMFGTDTLPSIKPYVDEHMNNINRIASMSNSDYKSHLLHDDSYNKLLSRVKNHHVDSDDFDNILKLKRKSLIARDFEKNSGFYDESTPDDDILIQTLKNHKLSAENLDKLVTDHYNRTNLSGEIRTSLYSHPNLSDDTKHKIISKLISNRHSYMIEHLLSHVKTLNTDHINRLYNSDVDFGHVHFSSDKFDLPRSMFEKNKYKFFDHKNAPADIVENAINNESLPAHILNRAITNKNLPVKVRIAAVEKSPLTPIDSDMADMLSKATDEEKDKLVHIRLNKNINTLSRYPLFDTSVHLNKKHINDMLADPHVKLTFSSTEANILHNPRVQHKELANFVDDPNLPDDKKSAILASGKLKEQNITSMLFEKQSDEIAKQMLDNPQTVPVAPKHIAHFLDANNKYHDVVKFKAIKHPSARLSHFDVLKDNKKFHGLISGLKNAPPSILHSLSASAMDHVRSNVASNPNTERKTLEILRHDPVNEIAEIAQKKLSKLK